MRYHFHPLDPLVLALVGYLMYLVAKNWHEFDTCAAPINVFLMASFILIISNRFFCMLHSCFFRIRKVRFCLAVLIYLIINPSFIYLTVQGIIWEQVNELKTPECTPDTFEPLILRWISTMVLISTLVFVFGLLRIARLYEMIRNRRRMQYLLERLIEYEEETMNYMLLYSAIENQNQVLGNHPGLTEEEIARIEKVNYKASLTHLLRKEDACPICYEEFIEDEEISKLPGCGHTYHSKCILSWFSQRSQCPMCRVDIRESISNRRSTRTVQDETYRPVQVSAEP